MNEQLGYRVTSQLKKDYDAFIKETYGHKRNKCGESLSKLMKFELAVNGYSDYVDDPDIQGLLAAARKIPCTHTQPKEDHDDEHTESNEDRFQKLEEKFEEQIAQLKAQLVKAVSSEPNKERDYYHRMDQFVSHFLEEYGDYKQVSQKEISKLVMRVHGVTDPRSITNRVDYLVANEYIEPYAPNVYNINELISK